MRVVVKGKGKRFVASASFAHVQLRGEGPTANDAVVALKRASLVQLAKEKGDAVLDGVDWHVERAGKREDANVELGVDIDVRETKSGWRYASPGGAVKGVARTLDDARRKAARASWKALAARVADEDFARAGGMRLGFEVKLTSAWIVDHRAPGMLEGGARLEATFADVTRALGKPRLDRVDEGEVLYGWGLRGKKPEQSAWVGVRVLGPDDELTPVAVRGFARRIDELQIAANDDKAAASVKRWLKSQL